MIPFNPLPDRLVFGIQPATMAMVGKRFNRWRVIMPAKPSGPRQMVLAQCDCGSIRIGGAEHIRKNRSKDCGCGRRASVGAMMTKHGVLSGGGKVPSEYVIWTSMLTRCYNPKNQNYLWYGGSGVTVCDRWRFGEDGESGFACFFKDMGKKPSPKHTIDRKNGGNYEPENCHWITMKEQCAPGKRRKYGSVVAALRPKT